MPALPDPAPTTPAEPDEVDGLSEREREVLSLVASGLGNGEIAETLYLSVNTVKTYIRTGYRKIGARSRSDAMLWWLSRDNQDPDRADAAQRLRAASAPRPDLAPAGAANTTAVAADADELERLGHTSHELRFGDRRGLTSLQVAAEELARRTGRPVRLEVTFAPPDHVLVRIALGTVPPS